MKTRCRTVHFFCSFLDQYHHSFITTLAHKSFHFMRMPRLSCILQVSSLDDLEQEPPGPPPKLLVHHPERPKRRLLVELLVVPPLLVVPVNAFLALSVLAQEPVHAHRDSNIGGEEGRVHVLDPVNHELIGAVMLGGDVEGSPVDCTGASLQEESELISSLV